jgi:hypothetical protein
MLKGVLSRSRALTSSATSDALQMVSSKSNFLFPPLFVHGWQAQGLDDELEVFTWRELGGGRSASSRYAGCSQATAHHQTVILVPSNLVKVKPV